MQKNFSGCLCVIAIDLLIRLLYFGQIDVSVNFVVVTN